MVILYLKKSYIQDIVEEKMKDTTSSRLNFYRRKKGLSKNKVSKILGCHINTYYLYEKGDLELPVRYAKKLGEFYRIDWWLLYED